MVALPLLFFLNHSKERRKNGKGLHERGKVGSPSTKEEEKKGKEKGKDRDGGRRKFRNLPLFFYLRERKEGEKKGHKEKVYLPKKLMRKGGRYLNHNHQEKYRKK